MHKIIITIDRRFSTRNNRGPKWRDPHAVDGEIIEAGSTDTRPQKHLATFPEAPFPEAPRPRVGVACDKRSFQVATGNTRAFSKKTRKDSPQSTRRNTEDISQQFSPCLRGKLFVFLFPVSISLQMAEVLRNWISRQITGVMDP